MGYRWDETRYGIWKQYNRRDPVWRVSHLDTDDWTVEVIQDAAAEILLVPLQVEAIYMHPRTWAAFWDDLKTDPRVTQETDGDHIAVGWVGNVDMDPGPPPPVPVRRPLVLAPVYVGWRVRPDRVLLVAKLPGEPFPPNPPDPYDPMGLLLDVVRLTTVIRVLS